MAGLDVHRELDEGVSAKVAVARWREMQARLLEIFAAEVAVDRGADKTPVELVPR